MVATSAGMVATGDSDGMSINRADNFYEDCGGNVCGQRQQLPQGLWQLQQRVVATSAVMVATSGDSDGMSINRADNFCKDGGNKYEMCNKYHCHTFRKSAVVILVC